MFRFTVPLAVCVHIYMCVHGRERRVRDSTDLICLCVTKSDRGAMFVTSTNSDAEESTLIK